MGVELAVVIAASSSALKNSIGFPDHQPSAKPCSIIGISLLEGPLDQAGASPAPSEAAVPHPITIPFGPFTSTGLRRKKSQHGLARLRPMFRWERALVEIIFGVGGQMGGGSQVPGLGECLKAAVVGLFSLRRETASGQFAVGQVIFDAVAADPAFVAGRVGASAVREVSVLFAFH